MTLKSDEALGDVLKFLSFHKRISGTTPVSIGENPDPPFLGVGGGIL